MVTEQPPNATTDVFVCSLCCAELCALPNYITLVYHIELIWPTPTPTVHPNPKPDLSSVLSSLGHWFWHFAKTKCTAVSVFYKFDQTKRLYGYLKGAILFCK